MRRWEAAAVLEAHTWNKDSHGLFDYESGSIIKQTLKTFRSVKIVRINDTIRLLTDVSNTKKLPEYTKLLGYLHEHNGIFTLSRENITGDTHEQKAKDDFWLVVKTLNTTPDAPGYLLKKNDVIKLGRAKFRIRDIRNTNQNEEETKALDLMEEPQIVQDYNKQEENNIDFLNQHVVKPMPENSETNCRICLFSDNEEDNPLVSPCGCSGSVKYVHITCLKHWIKSKAVIRSNGGYTQYVWKKIACELCHRMLPDIFIKKKEKVELIDIEKPSINSIILETIPRESQDGKAFYVIPAMPESLVKLGRGHDVNIRINDISVSRFHASLTYTSGKFYLQDNASKFGTSVLIKKNFVLSPDQNPGIQIGRTLFFATCARNPNQEYRDASNTVMANRPNPATLPGYPLKVSETPEEFEPLNLNRDLFQFSFQKPPSTQGQSTPNIFQKTEVNNIGEHRQPEILFQQPPDRQLPMFNFNLFQLNVPKDTNIFPNQNWFGDLGQVEMRANTINSKEERRRKRETIAAEMEKLEISNENNDNPS